MMAIGAGSRVRRGSSDEWDVIQWITLCWRACSGRRRSTLAIQKVPTSREYLLADFKQIIEFEFARFDISLLYVLFKRWPFADPLRRVLRAIRTSARPSDQHLPHGAQADRWQPT